MLFWRQFYHLCLQQKLLIVPALNMPLIKSLFLIDSTEIHLFGLQCRNVIGNLLKQTNKMIKKKVDNTVVLITAWRWPELNSEEALGNFEFSVVPKALFFNNGQPLKCTDKSSILHHIEELENSQQDVATTPDISVTTDEQRVIIIDGMAVANQIMQG